MDFGGKISDNEEVKEDTNNNLLSFVTVTSKGRKGNSFVNNG